MKTIRSSCFAALAFVLFGCTKETAKTPGVLYQLKVAKTASPIARVMAGTVQWASGYAYTKEIKFKAEDRSNKVEFRSEARKKLDLFAPLSNISTIEVPKGTYKEIEFEIEVAPSGADAAFLLNGSYTANGQTTPVVFKINSELEFETEKDNYTISSDNYTAVTTFDLSLLTQGITTAMLDAAARTNGTVEISAASNTALYNLMLDRLRNCGGIEIDD